MKPGKTILLVDDDADFAEALCAVLESAGFEVTSTGGLDAALELATSCPPDLVITDLMMSRLDDGFRLAAQLRELPGCAAVPVMVITAASARRGFDFRPRDAADLAAMGAQAFLEKPIAPADLIDQVQRLLAKPADGGEAER